MNKNRRTSWCFAVLAAAVALVSALVALAPTSAAATEATPNAPTYTLYTIESCPYCGNGRGHSIYDEIGTDSVAPFCTAYGWDWDTVQNNWQGLTAWESADTSIAKVTYDAASDNVSIAAGVKEGTTYVTLTAKTGDKVTVTVTVLDAYDHFNQYVEDRFTRPDVSDPSSEARAYLDGFHFVPLNGVSFALDAYDINVDGGDAYVGYTLDPTNATCNVTLSVSDPSVISVEDGGTFVTITPLKVGTATVTLTATDEARPEVSYTATCDVTVYESLPEPWDKNGDLLPYTIKDGVMTFDGRPDLGAWYQLDLDLGTGVTSGGYIGGGSLWTMTISASSLDASDPLYDADGWENGPFWVRADNRGAYTGLVLTVPEGKALSTSLEGSGTLVPSGNGSILLVQLSGPATLRASVADQTVLKNESGATLTHTPNSGELGGDDVWSTLTFVTEWIGGDEAQAAVDSLVASVDGVVGHPYVYDLHLLSIDGKVFPIPDGDSVTVTLPIPEGLSAEGLHVFHVADDGTVTDMNATVDAEAGTVSFTTTHFSTFVLANVKTDDGGAGGGSGEKTANELAATGDAGSVVALLAAASGSMALLGARVLRKRR